MDIRIRNPQPVQLAAELRFDGMDVNLSAVLLGEYPTAFALFVQEQAENDLVHRDRPLLPAFRFPEVFWPDGNTPCLEIDVLPFEVLGLAYAQACVEQKKIELPRPCVLAVVENERASASLKNLGFLLIALSSLTFRAGLPLR